MILKQQPQCVLCCTKATRVCCSQKCIRYPFICGGGCVGEKRVPEQIHDHENNSTLRIMSVEELDIMIDYFSEDHSRGVIANSSKEIENLKKRVDMLGEMYESMVVERMSLSLSEEARVVITRLNSIEKNSSNVSGKDIGYLQIKENVFKNYLKVQNQKAAYSKLFDTTVKSIHSQIDKLMSLIKNGLHQQIVIEEEEKREQNVDYQQKGKDAQQRHQYPQAIRYYKKILKEDSSNHQIYCELGKCELKIKKVKNACTNFRLSMKSNPNYVPAYYNLGEMYLNLGKHLKAAKEFQVARKLEPENPLHCFKLGVCYNSKKNHWSQAEKYLKRSTELGNEDAECYFQTGLALSKLKKNSEAINYFTKAIEKDGSKNQYYFNRGIAYQSQNNEVKATSDFYKAKHIQKINKDEPREEKEQVTKSQ